MSVVFVGWEFDTGAGCSVRARVSETGAYGGQVEQGHTSHPQGTTVFCPFLCESFKQIGPKFSGKKKLQNTAKQFICWNLENLVLIKCY